MFLKKNSLALEYFKSLKRLDLYKDKFKIHYIYTQKSGNKDSWTSKNIRTLIHVSISTIFR